jgi:hypothetical protein
VSLEKLIAANPTDLEAIMALGNGLFTFAANSWRTPS